MKDGWFAVKRGITSHDLFRSKPDRLMIWIWLIENACWKDTPHDIKGETVTVRRGQICTSERRIADKCGVGYQVVRTFLKRLQNERMINATVVRGKSIITLCNYESYQSSENQENAGANATPNATLTQRQRTKEQGNNTSVSKDTGEKVSPPCLKKVAFDAGIDLLVSSGKSEGASRGIIGKWLKVHGVGAVIDALSAAKLQGVIEPVGWIESRWKTKTAHVDHDGAILNHGMRLRKIRPPVQPREREPCRA